jgi:predicted transposase/invertase (TIGR01784 family)
MAKKQPFRKKQRLDPTTFMHQPHDKYARFVLQTKEVALELLQFCLAPEVCHRINLDSLELSNQSFIDMRLRTHFSDICYTGFTTDQKPIRVTIIFEHKSQEPQSPLTEQLIRYISNIWHNDVRQKQSLTLTIPIVLYHGPTRIVKEHPPSLFPDAPLELLPFVPTFDYVLLDIGSIADEHLENLQFLLLRNILLALKHSRNDDFIDSNWKKIIIFAPEAISMSHLLEIFQATAIYMSRTSAIFNRKIKDMDAVLSETEKAAVKPYLIQLYEEWREKGISEGIEKGVEKGIEQLLITFIQNNTSWSDQQIAASFNIPEAKVKKIRTLISHPT